jgi:hypothetical protein
MKFHPDQNRPGCQLQGSMNSCLGYQALRDEWNRQHWRVEVLETALREIVYETTHLSVLEDDGSHNCRISKDALDQARAALARQ